MRCAVIVAGCLVSLAASSCGAAEKKLAKYAIVQFVSNDSTGSRNLTVRKMNKVGIEFEFKEETISSQDISIVRGVANVVAGDLDILEDEGGNTYAAQQYILDGKCWVSIKIDQDQKVAQVTVTKCASQKFSDYRGLLYRR